MFFSVPCPTGCSCRLNTATIDPGNPYVYKWNAVASNGTTTEVAVCNRNAAAQGQGNDSNFAYSLDGGQTWVEGAVTVGTPLDKSYVSVAWNGSWWATYCYGDSQAARSQDGQSWTVIASTGTFNPWGNGEYASCLGVLPDNRFYGVYGNGNNTAILISANDGQTFVGTNVMPHSGHWAGVAHNGTNVVAVGGGSGGGGTNQAAYTTIANITSAWTGAVLPGSAIWQQVIWDGTYFVATASTGAAVRGARSLTGETWEEITLPTQAHQGVNLYDISNYGHLITDDRGSLWLSIWRLDNSGTPTTTTEFFCSSDHGSNWSAITFPSEDMWKAIGWSGFRLYGVENRTDANGGTNAWYSDER